MTEFATLDSRRASDEELAAALLVLEEEGVEGLTLDRVARRLGRSRSGGAASLPWPSESWLRSELAALGFRRLRAAIAAALDALAPDEREPIDAVMASGRAYVQNAIRNPALFGLMYQPELADSSHPDLRRDSSSAYAELRDRTQALQKTGFQPDRSVDELAGIVWDSVHRLAERWAEAALSGGVEASIVDEAIELEFTLLLGDAPRSRDTRDGASGEDPNAEAGRPGPGTRVLGEGRS